MSEIDNLKRLVRELLAAHDEKVRAELALAQADNAYQECDDEELYARMEDVEKASQALRQAEFMYLKTRTRMNIELAAARKDGEA